MIEYYSLEAIKLYMSWSEKLLKMVEERNRKVCSEYVFYLTNMKRDYPELQEVDELFTLFYENLETLSKNRFIVDYFRFELDYLTVWGSVMLLTVVFVFFVYYVGDKIEQQNLKLINQKLCEKNENNVE